MKRLLLAQVDIQLAVDGFKHCKHGEAWMTADVYGNIAGHDIPDTRAQPAEGRIIEDMRVMVNGADLFDVLPSAVIEQIEYDILRGDYL